MERCPNCRARWDGGATCRRCGMDLTTLLAVERAVETLAARAVAQLAAGAIPAAIDTLTQASRLSTEPFIGHLLAFSRTTPPDQQAPDDQPCGLDQRADQSPGVVHWSEFVGCAEDSGGDLRPRERIRRTGLAQTGMAHAKAPRVFKAIAMRDFYRETPFDDDS